MKNKTCFTSIDVEHDLGETVKKFQGVENLNKILDIFKKNSILATLFVTGEVLESYNQLVKEWAKDYEVACHTFSHQFWSTLNLTERENQLDNFFNLYQRIFQTLPQGFRAPSHLIDNEGMKLLEERGLGYDSSVVPHYPFFKQYRGFKGKAPLLPYYPASEDYRKKGNMKILEIPVRGQVFGIPLAGAWIGRLPFLFYKILFEVYAPNFITLNMHSWDILDFPGRKSSPERFLSNLDKIIQLLKDKNYQFLNGEQILKNRR